MPSLWTPTGWPQRLAELQASSGEVKEAPLRRDVRSLGMLLGEVIREQACDKLYEAVEALRRTAIARREAETPQGRLADAASAPGHLQQALDRVRSLDLAAAYQLTRAFGFYFELINLAETNHRKRRRLAHQLNEETAPGPIQRGDLRGTLRRLRGGWRLGCGSCAYALLRRICVYPVFTAHPTRSRAPKRHRSNVVASPTFSNSSIAFPFLRRSLKPWSAISRLRSRRCGRPTTFAARVPQCATKSAWRSITTNQAYSTRCLCSMKRYRLSTRRGSVPEKGYRNGYK